MGKVKGYSGPAVFVVGDAQYDVDVEVQARSLWARLKSYGSTAMADDRDDLRIKVVGGTVPDTSEVGELRLGDGQVLSASYYRHKFLAE